MELHEIAGMTEHEMAEVDFGRLARLLGIQAGLLEQESGFDSRKPENLDE